jgi:carboxymethylenebutenolidase
MPTTIDLATDDGVCPTHVFRPSGGPSGTGPWPAVFLYMDGLGIRPPLFEMAERIAAHGYYTVLPDLYYRSGPYEPMDAKAVFSDPEQRQILFQKFMSKLGHARAISDTKSILAFLASQPDVVPGPIGATGYCMGGGLAISAAGSYPDRFAAIGAYHPGNIANDAPDSPHLLGPKIKARVYIGRASEDPSFPDAMKDRLEAAWNEAGVSYTLETYPARHGWVPSDTPVHDAAAAERHWQTLFALFDGTLRG